MFTELAQEIRDCCSVVGMEPTTFGRKYLGDTKFVSRLEDGGRCWPETFQKAKDSINEVLSEHKAKANAAHSPEDAAT